jgi:holo-[acyl-carrier protein] synthase
VSKRVGLDLVSVDEVARSLSGPHRARYLERVYSEVEIDDCRTSAGIDPRRLAARFAAKEAALKVLSTGEDGVTLREIQVRTGASGEVGLILSGRAAARAEAMGVVEIAISLTCEARFAAAVVMIDGPETVHAAGRGLA